MIRYRRWILSFLVLAAGVYLSYIQYISSYHVLFNPITYADPNTLDTHEGCDLPYKFDKLMLGGDGNQDNEDVQVLSPEPRQNATLLILTRSDSNSTRGAIHSILSIENSFNKHYRYPYTIFDDPTDRLTDEQKQEFYEILPKNAVVNFATVNTLDWSLPPWLEEEEVAAKEAEMERNEVLYGEKRGYHYMCRWYSGPFALHPALSKYKYYWRLDPDVDFHCQIPYDPFTFLEQRDKVYGWNIALQELEETIPTLFETFLSYERALLTRNEGGIIPDIPDVSFDSIIREQSKSMRSFLFENNKFSKCHFWSNFEIASLEFFRRAEYQAFFRYLDLKGGFFLERWGDAPVHTLGLSLFARVDQVHYFEDIGYTHRPFSVCPSRSNIGCNCHCPGLKDNNYLDNYARSCLLNWLETLAGY